MAKEQGRAGGSGLGRVFDIGKRLLGTANAPQTDVPAVERRAGKRVALRLPVEICIEGGKFREAKIIDVGQRGLAVEPAEGAGVGQRVTVRFRASAAEVPAFVLQGRIVRVLPGPPAEAMGLTVRRNDNSEEALASFRKLVLYYLRHKPLLEGVDSGYFEGRCDACNWVGHVGRRNPRCALCGGKVEPLAEDADSVTLE